MDYNNYPGSGGISDGYNEAGINNSFGYLAELVACRQGCQQARTNRNYDQWYELLNAYYIALSARMEPKKGSTVENPMLTKHKQMRIECMQAYKHYRILKTRRIQGRSNMPELFFTWEQQLRQDENKLGLLMMNKEDPGEAFGKGGL